MEWFLSEKSGLWGGKVVFRWRKKRGVEVVKFSFFFDCKSGLDRLNRTLCSWFHSAFLRVSFPVSFTRVQISIFSPTFFPRGFWARDSFSSAPRKISPGWRLASPMQLWMLAGFRWRKILNFCEAFFPDSLLRRNGVDWRTSHTWGRLKELWFSVEKNSWGMSLEIYPFGFSLPHHYRTRSQQMGLIPRRIWVFQREKKIKVTGPLLIRNSRLCLFPQFRSDAKFAEILQWYNFVGISESVIILNVSLSDEASGLSQITFVCDFIHIRNVFTPAYSPPYMNKNWMISA